MSDCQNLIHTETQGAFSAELKRKRIDFVPEGTSFTSTSPQVSRSSSAGDRYLSIVFNEASLKEHDFKTTPARAKVSSVEEQQSDPKVNLCGICNLPVATMSKAGITSTRLHEASIAHMVCLEPSHPPCHLDRGRAGLRYLSSYGWDPDSRLGLGSSGQGKRAPIKVKMKQDTVGLGIKSGHGPRQYEKNVKILDAKQCRKKSLDDRKRRDRLQELLYGRDEEEKYLGGGET